MNSPAISLSPVSHAHLSLLYRWAHSEIAFGDFDEPSFDSAETIQRKFERGSFATTWIVSVDGVDVGFASYFHHPWNDWIAIIAVILADPAARGRGVGTEVHRQLSQMIFDTVSVAHKIEAYTDYANIAEQRTLEKNGFVQEGRTRLGGCIRGELRDMFLYGLLRSEHSAK